MKWIAMASDPAYRALAQCKLHKDLGHITHLKASLTTRGLGNASSLCGQVALKRLEPLRLHLGIELDPSSL